MPKFRGHEQVFPEVGHELVCENGSVANWSCFRLSLEKTGFSETLLCRHCLPSLQLLCLPACQGVCGGSYLLPCLLGLHMALQAHPDVTQILRICTLPELLFQIPSHLEQGRQVVVVQVPDPLRQLLPAFLASSIFYFFPEASWGTSQVTWGSAPSLLFCASFFFTPICFLSYNLVELIFDLFLMIWIHTIMCRFVHMSTAALREVEPLKL